MSNLVSGEKILYVLCAVWGVTIIGTLISATRLCYEIERRSGQLKPGSVPRYANVIPVAFNLGVARDDETQRLRRRMNQRLLLILLGFGLFALIVMQFAPR
jgi:hypothetical protein